MMVGLLICTAALGYLVWSLETRVDVIQSRLREIERITKGDGK